MENIKRFEVHAHTMYSNIRLIDCINRPEKLIDRAIENGLAGIAITDHEALCAHMEVNLYSQKIIKDNPNFKVALGNEIYLCQNREKSQKYYHFILIAKNKDGHRALRELSTNAWLNSYQDRGERCVTTYEDLRNTLIKYPNSLIGTTACLGGEASFLTMELIKAEKLGDVDGVFNCKQKILDFFNFCISVFQDDFYIEVAPGLSKDQMEVNQRLALMAESFNIKMVIGSDAHYLRKEDRFVHKTYLNSKDGEREVDAFYEYSYLQTEEEIKEHIEKSFIKYETLVQNSYEIYQKIENYSLTHTQTIPRVEIKEYPILANQDIRMNVDKYPVLNSLFTHEGTQERYWVNQCYEALMTKEKELEIDFDSHYEYLDRLEIEANVIVTIGEKLNDCLFAYFNTFQHYIDLFWECGSIVGPGRGSAVGFLSNYLLGITQLDPIVWELQYWRFLNLERVELPDIDVDLAPSKKPIILERIKKERYQGFYNEIPQAFKDNLGVVLVATFGSEKTKSAILTACRGYRSEEYPEGIDSDIGQYMTNLIPEERGFLWSLSDVINGDPDKDRKPVKTFIKEMNKYPGLIDVCLGIEDLVNKRSSHASGVIMFDHDPCELGCFMKTPSGEIITQYDLHMCEAGGMTKYDFLVTEVSDKLAETLDQLVTYNKIEDSSLRDRYNKYLHPSIIDTQDQRIWDSLSEGSVLDCFQFSTDVGLMAAKKLKPQTPLDMTNANALMRLMSSEKGGESPLDKYYRFKNNFPDYWYQEMKDYGVTPEEKNQIEEIYAPAYGCPAMQEDLMELLMQVGNFTLAEANDARKIIGKKQMSRIPELQEKIFSSFDRKGFALYIWDTCIKAQLGYAFSRLHSLPYSFVGIQALVLATKFNPIYWNTACLIVNSGSLDSEDEKSTDYGKVAKAIGDITTRGIKVSLVDINKSDYSFIPNEETNEILFGMKALNNVGAQVIEDIKAGRPYESLAHMMNIGKVKKTAMISLIKAGAFDRLEQDWANECGIHPRVLAMAYFLSRNCDAKKRITMQNFNGLMQKNLISDDLIFQQRVFVFNKYLKANTKVGQYFVFNEQCETFYRDYFPEDSLEVINGYLCINQKIWDKIYQSNMLAAKKYLQENQDEILAEFNTVLFQEAWSKYAQGTISAWEMESMCFYHSEHELINVNNDKYGLVDFTTLSPDSDIKYYIKRKNTQFPIYNLSKIIGTVISKNDSKSTISLLTTTGVVNVKFTKEYYAMFGRQLSEKQADGSKKIVEKGWFTRGTKVMCTGFRRGDTFVAKTYKDTPTHQLYKITKVENGEIELVHERYGKGDLDE